MNSFTATRAPANPNWIRHAVLTLTLAAALVLGLTAAVGTTPASAMTPPQTTLKSTMNTLYWELDGFWRYALGNSANYASPTIDYYDSPYTPPGCGGTLYDYTIMAYCDGNQIWVEYAVNQGKVDNLGDYAAGFFLAHEWGHHIAHVLGLDTQLQKNVRARELYADCMAGVFTRYEYSYGGKLDAHDYWEGISSLDDHFPNEGGGNGYPLKSDRKDSYWAGFNTYSLATCQQVVPAAGASTTVVISNTGGGPANVKRGQKAVRPALGKPSKHKASKRHMEVILG